MYREPPSTFFRSEGMQLFHKKAEDESSLIQDINTFSLSWQASSCRLLGSEQFRREVSSES